MSVDFNFYDFLEKHYFYELDSRDRITGRCQIAFSTIAAGLTLMFYIYKNLAPSEPIYISLIIVLCLSLSFTFSAHSLLLFIKAFHNNEYLSLPSADEIIIFNSKLLEHKIKIDKYNADYPDHAQPEFHPKDSLVSHIHAELVKCNTHNFIVNRNRSALLNNGFRFMIWAAIPLFLSGMLFLSFDTDMSSPYKKSANRVECGYDNAQHGKLY